MTTEDSLKIKFVPVCAFASEAQRGRHLGIPPEKLMDEIRINNHKIGFRDDNRLVAKNQAAAIKSLLRSCGIDSYSAEIA